MVFSGVSYLVWVWKEEGNKIEIKIILTKLWRPIKKGYVCSQLIPCFGGRIIRLSKMKITVSILAAFFLQNFAWGQSYFKNDYPAVWQRASSYTMEVAEAMPQTKYGFKPKDGSMNFHGQMVHIIQNLSYLSGQITGTPPDFFNGANPATLSKEEVAAALQMSFSYVSNLIKAVNEKTLAEQTSFAGEKMTKENIFYLMRDHMTHHRGQAILYLRINGIEPPKYRGW